ncbi:MAG: NAD(P)/FAD-dependent oxidoreductase [Mycobacterium sp.]
MSDSVAVIGAGLAGATIVRTLREKGFTGRVSLIGDEVHLPYERPMLSKEFLTTGVSFDTLQVRPMAQYEADEIELVLGRRAIRVLPGVGVHIEGGAVVPAEHAFLCTGVRPRSLPVRGSELPGVISIRNLEDAEALREAVARGDRTVVVGEGFIGSEVAATLAGRGADVTLLMGRELPMQPALGPEAGAWLLAEHRKSGIDVRERSSIRSIGGGSRADSVELADGTVIRAGAVVMAVGCEPNVDLAIDAGLALDDGVLVNSRGLTSSAHVHAVGDIARFPSATFGRTLRVEHWQHAQHHAHAAAAALVGESDVYDGIPWAWSVQHGHRIEIAGLPWAADSTWQRGDPNGPDGALWISVRAGQIVGALSVNRRRELRAVLRALGRAPVIVGDGRKLADPDSDLRMLLDATASA